MLLKFWQTKLKVPLSDIKHLSYDDPAGYFLTGIAGGLGRKIVGRAVDNYSFADYISDSKAVREKSAPCNTLVAKERGQVARVIRMGTVIWIVVSLR